MLPDKLEGDSGNPHKYRRLWRILRADFMTEIPGFPYEADRSQGTVTMLQVTPAQGDKAEQIETKQLDFGPDGIRIVAARAFALLLCLGLGLSACARVQMFTAGDIANAEAIATAGGDKTGAACWASLEPAVAAAPNPNAEGLATGAERSRLLQATLGGPCGGVAAPVLLSTLKQLPGLLLPLAHLPLPVP